MLTSYTPARGFWRLVAADGIIGDVRRLRNFRDRVGILDNVGNKNTAAPRIWSEIRLA